MSTVIEIENGLVSVIERNVNTQVSLTDWMSKIEKRSPITTPVLPLGTRAVHWDQTDLRAQRLIVLIEQQPQIINLNFEGDIHRLSIPYTRFFFYCTTTDPSNRLAWRLDDYRIYWAKSQYNDPVTRDMIPALVPNVYPDGRICFGSTGADANQSLAQRLNQTCNEFYISEFNSDLTIRRPNQGRGWRQWERMTATDPTGWMKWRDFDPMVGWHTYKSFETCVADAGVTLPSVARLDPMIAAEPIPPVPIGASFGRIREWTEPMLPSQRARLLSTLQSMYEAEPALFSEAVMAAEDEA